MFSSVKEWRTYRFHEKLYGHWKNAEAVHVLEMQESSTGLNRKLLTVVPSGRREGDYGAEYEKTPVSYFRLPHFRIFYNAEMIICV